MLVALDVASRTGVAVGEPGGTPRAWSVNLGTGDDERYANALKLTDRLIREYRPTMVAIEAPIGGSRTSHLLVGLVACIRGACRARGVAVEAHNIASVRKFFLGMHISSVQFQHLPVKARKAAARKEAKAAVMARCRSLGWPAVDEDACDGLALWDFAASRMSHAHGVLTAGGLFRE